MIASLWLWCVGSALVGLLCIWRPPRWLRGTFLLLMMTLLAWAIAVASGALAMTLRTYAVLALERPVATVTCEAIAGDGTRWRLAYHPEGPPGTDVVYELAGDQWMLSGDMLRWHPWLLVAGFEPAHKPTRLSGRFADAERERAQPPSVHELNGGTDPVWRWLHRYGRWLPLVEAVYGSSTYTFAEPGRTWTVYVTPSGYLVK